MNPDIIYLSTELDLIYGLMRGETVFLYVPDSKEGEHWTVSISSLQTTEEDDIFEVVTSRGTVKVKVR